MFIHVHSLNRPILIVIFAFAMPIGFWNLGEVIHAWQAKGSPVVEGIVMKREACRRFGGIPAVRMCIKIENSETTVVAELTGYQFDRFGKRVRFHYGGDPTIEVFLDGESDPGWAAAFFLGAPLLLLALYLKFRGKPGMEHVID